MLILAYVTLAAVVLAGATAAVLFENLLRAAVALAVPTRFSRPSALLWALDSLWEMWLSQCKVRACSPGLSMVECGQITSVRSVNIPRPQSRGGKNFCELVGSPPYLENHPGMGSAVFLGSRCVASRSLHGKRSDECWRLYTLCWF